MMHFFSRRRRFSMCILAGLFVSVVCAYGYETGSLFQSSPTNIVSGQNLEVILSAPTTGWKSVGFDPSSQMKDANYIMCAVVSDVATARDDFGVSAFSHSSDTSLGGEDTITIIGGTETNERTEVQFTIPLDSGDEYDRPLVEGNEYIVLLAELRL
jgi:hypothetical protein